MDRPSVYDPALAAELCQLISEGHALNQIVRQRRDMPWKRTISIWRSTHPEFADMLRTARQAQADHFAEEIIEIADDGSNDWMTREAADGTITKVVDHEHIQRSRVRIDARKWLASKMAPAHYGDTVAVTGPSGDPLVVEHRLVVDRVMAALTDGTGLVIEGETGEGEA